jgi:hypothetical protein
VAAVAAVTFHMAAVAFYPPQLGVVAAAADDWALSAVLPVFGTCAASLGVCTMTLGGWAERVGPRKVSLAAAACWGSGLMGN